LELNGKISVVTGASTGIGRAIAKALSAEGATVALVGRNRDGLEISRQQIEKVGGKSKIFYADLTQVDAITRLATDIINTYKSVDIVANIAGSWHDNHIAYVDQYLENISTEQILEVINVNLLAPIFLAQQFVPAMKKQSCGKILNISGTFSDGGAKWLHYFTAKQAVEIFTVGLADELRDFNIQVNCISPSDVATEASKKFFPDLVGPVLDPDEVAKLAVWLVSSKTANNITGQTIVVKGSNT